MLLNMAGESLMLEVLQGIRSDIQLTNARLDRLGEDLNVRLDQTNARLDRVVEGQIRMGTQVNERLERVEQAIVGLNGRTITS